MGASSWNEFTGCAQLPTSSFYCWRKMVFISGETHHDRSVFIHLASEEVKISRRDVTSGSQWLPMCERYSHCPKEISYAAGSPLQLEDKDFFGDSYVWYSIRAFHRASYFEINKIKRSSIIVCNVQISFLQGKLTRPTNGTFFTSTL